MSLKDRPLVNPRQAPTRVRLFELARQAGQDTEVLRDILWQITAHCHLIALPKAMSQLLNILKLAPKSWHETIERLGIHKWQPVLEWVVNTRKTIREELDDKEFNLAQTARYRNPIMDSGVTAFPLYTCLCETPPPAAVHRDQFILLVGHLSLAHIHAIQQETQRSDYEDFDVADAPNSEWKLLPNELSVAARAVRRLNETDSLRYLQELPVSLSPVDFAMKLEQLYNQRKTEYPDDRKKLYQFLQKSWNILDWKETGQGAAGGGGSGGHAWVGGRWEIGKDLTVSSQPIGDDLDPVNDWGGLQIAKIQTLNTKLRKQNLQSDLSPDEDDEDIEIVLSDFDCKTSRRDIGSLVRIARAKARHVAMANQLVPWAYAGLATQEIAKIVSQASQEFTQKRAEQNPQNRLDIETLFLIHCMLWTGSDVQRATSLRINCQEATDQSADLELIVPQSGSIDKLIWRIKALTPEYKTELTGTPEQLRACQPILELPDLIGLAPFVQTLQKYRLSDLRSGSFFFHSPSVLEKKLTAWLKTHSKDSRITTTKLANTLWNRLYLDLGDPTLASCITGTMHNLVRVRLFYTTPSTRKLLTYYSNAINNLTRQLYAALNKPAKEISPDKVNPINLAAIGARLCPTKDAVKALFSRLRSDIEQASDYTDRSGFVTYHNLLTLYTVQYFAYATTCRAIVTPYLDLSQIHPERGIARLSDKDDASFHKTRLIWISEDLRQHMADYASHLNCWRSQFLQHCKDDLHVPIFFLSDACIPERVSPKNIEPRLGQYLNVRANTHRRFLRTQLIECQCPTEVVDAFMGHWQQGEEPFGQYSSFSYAVYVANLKKFLLPLLKEIGLGKRLAFRLAV